MSPHQMLILPGNEAFTVGPTSLRRLQNTRREAGYYSYDGRRMLYDTLGVFDPVDIGIFPAIADFAEENKSALSDFNSFTGGGVTAVTNRTGKFHKALRELDVLAMQAAQAPASQRAALRSQFNAAHTQLNKQFAQELRMLVGSRGYINRYSPFLHKRSAYRQAQKLNARGRSLPLMGQPEMRKLMTVMESAKWAGRGILVIDLASRSHTVANSENKSRAVAREATGFGVSTLTAGLTYSAGVYVGLALGPWGLVALVVAAGAAAVAGDYFGKSAFDGIENRIRQRRPLVRR